MVLPLLLVSSGLIAIGLMDLVRKGKIAPIWAILAGICFIFSLVAEDFSDHQYSFKNYDNWITVLVVSCGLTFYAVTFGLWRKQD